MSYHQIMSYLKAHPTPWRFIRETDLLVPGAKAELIADGYHDVRQCSQEKRDVVEDANGNTVIASWDRDETTSHIEGDVRALVDFVNLVGEEYEPQHGWDTYESPGDAALRYSETALRLIKGGNGE